MFDKESHETEFDEETFQFEIERMHDRLFVNFFGKMGEKDLYQFMASLYESVFYHEIGLEGDFDYDELSQDDDNFKNFLFKKETALKQLTGIDYHTQLQRCIFPNHVIAPYSYKRAFTIALERFLKDLEKQTCTGCNLYKL